MKVGFSKVCITPPVGVHLEGYSARTLPSIGIHDDLYVSTLVLEVKNEQIVLISCDLIGIPVELSRIVKAEIKTLFGIPEGNVLIAATHTHSGPIVLGLQQYDELSRKWMNYLPDYVVGSVRAAISSLQEGVMAYGTTTVTYVGKNRRTPSGPVDPQLFVLHFKNTGGEELGGIVNYTCHGTVLDYRNLFISSDYIGYLRHYLNLTRQTAIPFLFFNGAEGNINIGYSADLSALGKDVGRERTFKVAERMGKVLAFESSRLIEEMEVYQIPQCAKTLIRRIKIKIRKPRDQYTLVQAIKAADDPLERFYLSEELEFAKANPPNEVDVDLQIIKLNDLYIFAVPGEPFVEIGLALKRYAGTSKSIVVGLANGWFGYIPTEKAFESVGYETRLGKWSYLDRKAESLILETFLNMISEVNGT